MEPAISGPGASFGALATTKISVAASLAGRIIGKNGVNSKQICRETSVKLAIREHESNPDLRNIELEGTLEQIQRASALVTDLTRNLGSIGGPRRLNRELPPVASKYKTKAGENFAKGSAHFGMDVTLHMGHLSCGKQGCKALVNMISNPVNSTVPIAAKIFKNARTYDEKKLFGVTTLDVVRA